MILKHNQPISMGRSKMTTEEREKKKEELIIKMRKLFDMVGDVNKLSLSIGLKQKIDNSISLGVFSLRPALIVEYVNKRFDCDISIVSRKASLVFARQIAMHLLRKFTRLSLLEISEYTGVADHTTVIHGIKRLNNLIETEENTKTMVEQCEADIYAFYKQQMV